MKNKIFKKTTIFTLGKVIVVSIVLIAGLFLAFKANPAIKTEVLEIKSVASTIQADGVVTPQSQAILHFQTGGKLIHLSFKVGDSVWQGQTIAQLDVAKLQANLRQAEQDFTAAKAASEKLYNDQGNKTDESFDEKVKRTAVDAAQNKAYDSVVKARQDIADATLISPMNGILTQEDVSVVNVNITPATSFTVADPSLLVFRANVSENDIDFISVGNAVAIKLNSGEGKTILGTVNKIYPDKTTLLSGQKGYSVDIQSNSENQFNIIGQSGIVLIQSNSENDVKLVPTWTVLNNDSIWVIADSKPVLRNVMVGKTHGDMTEILNGLQAQDKVITNPESIAAQKYSIL